MAQEVIKEGTKVEDKEAKKLDPAKMGVGLAGQPKQAQVEGQHCYWAYVRCPWCCNINRCMIDTNVYLWYRCGYCGGAFRA